MSEIAPIGHNGSPEPTPYEVIKAHIEDLLIEARNWADGAKVETQEQSDEVKRLQDDLRDAEKAADAQRVIEKAPFDEKIDEIQTRYNVFIAPLRNKKPGKIPLAMDALRKTNEPWLKKLDDDRKAEAARLQKIADDEAEKAILALAAARESSSLEAKEDAEELVQAATQAQVFARRAAAPVPTGLRTSWVPTITDRKVALLHYLATRPEAFEGLLLDLAKEDGRSGKRQIPGVTFTEEKHAA